MTMHTTPPKRKLSPQETARKRLAILLTELEAAAGQVLAEQFNFTPEQTVNFLELLRQKYRSDGNSGPVDLRTVPQQFALSGMETLLQQYNFSQQQLDRWVAGLLRHGFKNRETV